MNKALLSSTACVWCDTFTKCDAAWFRLSLRYPLWIRPTLTKKKVWTLFTKDKNTVRKQFKYIICHKKTTCQENQKKGVFKIMTSYPEPPSYLWVGSKIHFTFKHHVLYDKTHTRKHWRFPITEVSCLYHTLSWKE